MSLTLVTCRYHAARVGRLLPEVELQTLSNKQPLSQQDLVANARAQAIQSRILENLDPSRSGSQSQQAAATSQKQDSAAQRNSIFNALTAGGTKNWQALDLGRKGNLEEAAEKAEYNAHLDHMMAGAYAEVLSYLYLLYDFKKSASYIAVSQCVRPLLAESLSY